MGRDEHDDPIADAVEAKASPRASASGLRNEEQMRHAQRRAIAIPALTGLVAAAVVVIVSIVSTDGVGTLGVAIVGLLAVSGSLYAYLSR